MKRLFSVKPAAAAVPIRSEFTPLGPMQQDGGSVRRGDQPARHLRQLREAHALPLPIQTLQDQPPRLGTQDQVLRLQGRTATQRHALRGGALSGIIYITATADWTAGAKLTLQEVTLKRPFPQVICCRRPSPLSSCVRALQTVFV
jgi:hypothetical protein